MKDILNSYSKEQLKETAKRIGIYIKSNLKKDDIIEALVIHADEKTIKKSLKPSWWTRNKISISAWTPFIGLLLTLIIYIFPNSSEVIISNKKPDKEIESKVFRNSLFNVTQELRRNKKITDEIRDYINRKTKIRPSGELKITETMLFIKKYYDTLVSESYGEEKHLYQDILLLNDILENYNSKFSREEYVTWNSESKMTSDDISFLFGFLHWYIGNYSKDRMSERLNYSINIELQYSSDFVNNSDLKSLKMRYFTNEDQPIISYADYLGLID